MLGRLPAVARSGSRPGGVWALGATAQVAARRKEIYRSTVRLRATRSNQWPACRADWGSGPKPLGSGNSRPQAGGDPSPQALWRPRNGRHDRMLLADTAAVPAEPARGRLQQPIARWCPRTSTRGRLPRRRARGSRAAGGAARREGARRLLVVRCASTGLSGRVRGWAARVIGAGWRRHRGVAVRRVRGVEAPTAGSRRSQWSVRA
jgi:hypothetical protein